MKLLIHLPVLRRRSSVKSKGGFTLPELLISITVFGFLITGVIFAHLYGLSMFRITDTKLKSTGDARITIGRIANEIQTSTSASVGNVSTNGVFAGMLDGDVQQGNGLMIYPTTNSANYILYFVNQKDTTFRRATSAQTNTVILARSITNLVAFRVQDHLGNVMTNNSVNRVIHIDLEFFQAKRFRQVAEYYKLETSVTRRALE